MQYLNDLNRQNVDSNIKLIPLTCTNSNLQRLMILLMLSEEEYLGAKIRDFDPHYWSSKSALLPAHVAAH
jgi:hypothetical protein